MNKVFFVIPNLAAGGAERVSITFARLLKKNGLIVEFVNLGGPRGEMEKWIKPEFDLVSFGYDRVLQSILKLHSFMKQQQNEVLFFGSREHVNIVNLLAARGTKCQVIARIPNMPRNNLSVGQSGYKMQVIKRINRWLLPKAKFVIAQNDEMRKQLLRYYSLSDEKVVTINNPIDEDYVKRASESCVNPYPKKSTVFLAACTIDYRKGIDVLMRAWPYVKSQIPNALMFVIGRNTSEYAQQLEIAAKDLDGFTFLGFQSNPYTYMKNCDVFVLSSRMEGFPNVLLEAMCLNRPVASTTCVEVIRDIVKEGVNGYCCNIEDPKGLAVAMTKASKLEGITNNYNLFKMDKLLEVFG